MADLETLRDTAKDLYSAIADDFLTDGRWNLLINQINRMFVVRTAGIVSTDTQSIVAGTSDHTLPTDCARVIRVWYDGTDPRELVLTDPSGLYQQIGDGWRSLEQDPPEYYLTQGLTKIRMVPIPAANETDGLLIDYIDEPAILVDNTDVPEVPTIYHHFLSFGAVALACMIDVGNTKKEEAQGFMEVFNMGVMIAGGQ
jgi:hypothetical protein